MSSGRQATEPATGGSVDLAFSSVMSLEDIKLSCEVKSKYEGTPVADLLAGGIENWEDVAPDQVDR